MRSQDAPRAASESLDRSRKSAMPDPWCLQVGATCPLMGLQQAFNRPISPIWFPMRSAEHGIHGSLRFSVCPWAKSFVDFLSPPAHGFRVAGTSVPRGLPPGPGWAGGGLLLALRLVAFAAGGAAGTCAGLQLSGLGTRAERGVRGLAGGYQLLPGPYQQRWSFGLLRAVPRVGLGRARCTRRGSALGSVFNDA